MKGMRQMIRLAYLSDWNLTDLPEGDAAKLTHIHYSFAVIKDGRASTEHWKNEGKIRELISRYPKLKFGIALGGWGAGGFSEAMVTEASRAALADSMLEIIKEYGFAGMDLDWEYPCEDIAGIAAAPEDRERFPLFIRLMREKLDLLGQKNGRHYLLTMAVGAGERFAGQLDFAKMIDCVDYVNLMSYDMGVVGKDFADHHTNLRQSVKGKISAVKAADVFLKYGVPPEKLVIGAAFYGRSCRVTERGEHNGLYMPQVPESEGGLRYDDIAAHIEKGAELFWDEAASAPYLYNDADKFFGTFDNERSIKEKARYVRENGLGGIMYWEYNSDKKGVLLNALYEGMTG
jgi:chitinase